MNAIDLTLKNLASYLKKFPKGRRHLLEKKDPILFQEIVNLENSVLSLRKKVGGVLLTNRKKPKKNQVRIQSCQKCGKDCLDWYLCNACL